MKAVSALKWRRRATGLIAAVVGAFCVYYMVVLFPWSDVIQLPLHRGLSQIAVAASVLLLLTWLLRSVRFWTIARVQGADIPFPRVYLFTALSIGLAVVTPLQSGEVMKMHLVRDVPGFSLGRMVKIFLSERSIDVAVLAWLTLIGVAVLASGILSWAAAAAAGLIGGAYAFFAVLPASAPRLTGLLFAGVGSARGRMILLATTVGCWVVTAALWWTALLAVGVRLDPVQVQSLVGVVTFASIASAIPGGLGVSEVSSAMVLLQFGVPSDLAHGGALALRALMILVLALAVLHLPIWRLTRRPQPNRTWQ